MTKRVFFPMEKHKIPNCLYALFLLVFFEKEVFFHIYFLQITQLSKYE